MADYQYTGFDAYGYEEPTKFVSLEQQCGMKYDEKGAIEPTLTEVESFVSQTYPSQNILSTPKNKCLKR